MRAILILLLVLSPSFAGEVTQEASPKVTEPQYLWKEARTQFGKGNDAEAARLLQRFVDLYPGQEGYLDAHLLLAITRMRLKDNEAAVPLLKYYISAAPRTMDGLRTRLTLGEAYMKLGRPTDAILLATEILQVAPKGELTIQALLLQAWAQSEKGKNDAADLALRSAHQSLKNFSDTSLKPSLQAHAWKLELELKLKKCSQLIGAEKLTEAETLDAFHRQSQCLLETFPLYRKILLSQEDPWVTQSEELLVRSFEAVAIKAQTPPLPPDHRTPEELQKYHAELSDRLQLKWQSTRKQALQILDGWKAEVSTGWKPHLDRLMKAI